MRQKKLPDFYYLEHFCEIISWVITKHQPILNPETANFISVFGFLNKDAQSLFVRLSNRVDTLFRLESLNYEEIKNIHQAMLDLVNVGFLESIEREEPQLLLNTFTKPELLKVFIQSNISVKLSWSKNKLINLICSSQPLVSSFKALQTSNFIRFNKSATVELIKFLYFGNLKDSQVKLTQRDLGLVRINQSKVLGHDYVCLQQVEIEMFYERFLRKSLITTEDIDQLIQFTYPNHLYTSKALILRDKALMIAAAFHAKNNSVDLAIYTYRLSNHPQSEIEIIKLILKQDDINFLESTLLDIIYTPKSDESYHYAYDIYQRKFERKKLKENTLILKDSKSIALDEVFINSPEQGAVLYLRNCGIQAWKTENRFWMYLFGILFWEMLFEHPGSFYSPFDNLPKSLIEGTFFQENFIYIDQLLDEVRNNKGNKIFNKNLMKYHNKPNGLFRWNWVKIECINALFDHLDPNKLADLLLKIAQSFSVMNSGYPDLMTLSEGELQFCEVKAPGDAIRHNQLVKIKQLNDFGIKTSILKIIYQFNPEQTYVVVDVETTGGKRAGNRVIEIGAVKVRNNEIIDEWQSLIHPGRYIPQSITKLTGITNQMVANAPSFSEIFQSFDAFLQGAIFVAHNVNFDYWFINMEYIRLGRRLRMPKYCTCSQSRKNFPGIKSYGLANLSNHFGIVLHNHHRALNDAKATAELLILNTVKRYKLESTGQLLVKINT